MRNWLGCLYLNEEREGDIIKYNHRIQNKAYKFYRMLVFTHDMGREAEMIVNEPNAPVPFGDGEDQ